MDRGQLEKIIDDTIAGVPELVQIYREESVKKQYFIKSEEDFAFGYSIARIFYPFKLYFSMTRIRAMTEDEEKEMHKIINKRLAEIRNAILNCG